MTDQSPETPQVAAAAVSRRLATESDLAHARTLLQPDEAILWTIKTDPQEFKNQAIFFGVFGIPIVLFMLLAMSFIVFNVVANFSFAFIAWGVMLFVAFMMLCTIGMVCFFVWPLIKKHAAAGKTSIYVLSNRRFFTSTPGMSTPLEQWELSEIKDVSSRANPDGTGDLQYRCLKARSTGPGTMWVSASISGVPDIQTAEKLWTAAVDQYNKGKSSA